MSRIEELPPVLCLVLKRFESRQKVSKPIVFCGVLDLTRFCLPVRPAKVEYKLHAVINHHGESVYAGHYTTMALGANRYWYKFDDSHVAKILPSSVTSSPRIYMAFYQLSEETNTAIEADAEKADAEMAAAEKNADAAEETAAEAAAEKATEEKLAAGDAKIEARAGTEKAHTEQVADEGKLVVKEALEEQERSKKRMHSDERKHKCKVLRRCEGEEEGIGRREWKPEEESSIIT